MYGHAFISAKSGGNSLTSPHLFVNSIEVNSNLETQAEDVGGRVHILLGNHEVKHSSIKF
jgi:hypothetical protein